MVWGGDIVKLFWQYVEKTKAETRMEENKMFYWGIFRQIFSITYFLNFSNVLSSATLFLILIYLQISMSEKFFLLSLDLKKIIQLIENIGQNMF